VARTYGEKKDAYRILYEEKRQLGRWNDNINMDIKNWIA
jgi:hypothetical protein